MTAPIPRPADFRAGGPPPWADLDEEDRFVDLARARACLTGRAGKPADVEGPDDRVSAVLVPLFEDEGELRVILTLRNPNLRSHAGQVSFPGGRLDPGEDPPSPRRSARRTKRRRSSPMPSRSSASSITSARS